MREIRSGSGTGISLRPSKKDKAIKEWKYWAIVLGISNAIYTAMAVLVIYNGVIK